MTGHRPKGLPKTGGRMKGTPNKDRRELYDMLRDKFGDDFDPVVEAAQIAHDLKGSTDLDAIDRRLKALSLVAKYTRPTLRSVEHRGAAIENLNMTVRFVDASGERVTTF